MTDITDATTSVKKDEDKWYGTIRNKLKLLKQELEKNWRTKDIEPEELKQLKRQLAEVAELVEKVKDPQTRGWWNPRIEFLHTDDKKILIIQCWDTNIDNYVDIVPSGKGWKKTYGWGGITVWTQDISRDHLREVGY